MNKKSIVVGGLMTLAVLALLASCVSMANNMPGRTLPLASAEYTILGETSAKAEMSILFGFIPLGDEKKYGTIDAAGATMDILGKMDPASKVKSAALYKALEQMPEADAVLDPKFTVEETNWLIGVTYKVTVKARGIKYAEGAVKKAASVF